MAGLSADLEQAAARAMRWLGEAETELARPRCRDLVDFLKVNGDLAYVASRMAAHGRDGDGVWSELARRAWLRLERGEILLQARRRHPAAATFAALYLPFHDLGLRSRVLEATLASERAAIPIPMARVVVGAARLRLAGHDPSALGDEVIAILRRTPAERMTTREVYYALHMLWLVWPGSIPAARRAPVVELLGALAGRVLDERHVDLAGELLISERLAGAPASPALWRLVLEAQRGDGMFPAFAGQREVGDGRARFDWGYHSTLVALLAMALAGRRRSVHSVEWDHGIGVG